MSTYTFPESFLWGAATSAYQVEGSTEVDGRGESIWDRFCRVPGAVRDGSSGEPACDHYRRWRDDVTLMRRLHLNSYRFSIAWPRLFPNGSGALNRHGMDFYDRLVDELLAHDIQPLATLYHWDLPAGLQDAGGWVNRDTAFRFRDYAAAMFERLGDRIGLWITVNEPWVASMLGHFYGWHAPGVRDAGAAVQAAHHLLLAHGLAVQAFDELGLRSFAGAPGEQESRRVENGGFGLDAAADGRGGTVAPRPSGRGGRIGIALDIHAYAAADDGPRDREAVERARTLEARWFLEPLTGRGYPADGLAWYEAQGVAPSVRPGDMDEIARPLDFLGINYYRRHVIAADEATPLFGYRQVVKGDVPVTGLGWEVYPAGLHDVLEWVWRSYAESAGVRWLLVTENGAAYPDEVTEGDDGPRVHDAERLEYLRAHLHEVWRAIQKGVPVRGYYAWSLLDNFEWAHGYTQRFGIVYVDFKTQRRVVKDSGRWYAAVAHANALSPMGEL